MTAAVATDRPRTVTVGKLVIWLVAAVCFAYVTWQAIGNMIVVPQRFSEFNSFVTANGPSLMSVSPFTSA